MQENVLGNANDDGDGGGGGDGNNGFAIVGKGVEYQTRTYPFIKSYDNVSEVTEETRLQIDAIRRQAQQSLQQLRRQHIENSLHDVATDRDTYMIPADDQ